MPPALSRPHQSFDYSNHSRQELLQLGRFIQIMASVCKAIDSGGCGVGFDESNEQLEVELKIATKELGRSGEGGKCPARRHSKRTEEILLTTKTTCQAEKALMRIFIS